jgi:hypothetical protein
VQTGDVDSSSLPPVLVLVTTGDVVNSEVSTVIGGYLYAMLTGAIRCSKQSQVGQKLGRFLRRVNMA